MLHTKKPASCTFEPLAADLQEALRFFSTRNSTLLVLWQYSVLVLSTCAINLCTSAICIMKHCQDGHDAPLHHLHQVMLA